jgi:hypothetical protein
MAEEQSGEVAVEEISLGTHFHGKNIHNCVLVPRELVVHELALPVPSGPIQISVLFSTPQRQVVTTEKNHCVQQNLEGVFAKKSLSHSRFSS